MTCCFWRKFFFRLWQCIVGFALSSSMVCAVQVQAVRAQQVQHMPTVEISAAALKREHIQMAVAKKSTTVSKHIDGLAYVEDDLRRVANIRPIGTGRVTSIEVVKGQSVRKGQVLIKYDNFFMRDEKDRLTVAKAMLQEARAQQMSAEQIYQRGKKLSGGALSVSEVERRKIALQAANAVVQQREAELRGLLEHMGRYDSSTEQAHNGESAIISPLDGIVTRISVTNGQEISSNGVPPIEICDLSQVWVVTQVDAHQASEIRSGNEQLTWVTPDRPPLRSVVNIVDGNVDVATQHVLIRSLVNNSDGCLRTGMFVRTRIFLSQKVSGVIIPEAAVQKLEGVPVVFVRTSAEHYTAKPVTLGPTLDGNIVITKGIEAGDTVVTNGSFTLKEQAIFTQDTQATSNDG